jgi:hypothetical protein
LVRQCIPIPQKIYSITKRSRTTEEVEKYFHWLYIFYRLYIEQQIPRPADNKRKKIFYSLGKKKRHTLVKTHLMVNDHGVIIHKAGYKKGKRHDYDIMRHGHNSNLFSIHVT